MKINYKINEPINANELATVFSASGIRRPVEDVTRLEKMLNEADILITAWHNDQVIGVARALTDYSYCCYLSDLAVDKRYQSNGIGKKLIELLQNELSEEVALLLLSSPTAMDYYPHIGFEKIDNGFIIKRKK
ncbi:GNAT family N-acetyltransferase [Alkalihalobacillus sp. LMS39]|uniref:GNAT family N-acetyltransferase n=1 Tax=Alkalihalobacillus sp. LMS39 TaxID=2924032 RepID=UPI001FB439FC|nr:GNAT family N-acetyltransferase [Alkalihalobacillus sp. LMS39]UOE96245.1 GNAT family N-acetyltransferase [Alkalihalobacillus sp. LMS39]